MIAWFEDLIKDILWNSIRDLVGIVGTYTEAAVEKALRSIKVGDKLSDSPLVVVLGVDNTQDTLTLLIRGRIALYPGAVSAFVRIELVLLRNVNFSTSSVVTIKQWSTLMGELQLGQDKVFDVRVALGYDRGSFIGRGALKLKPPVGLGFDLFLGGLNDRGAMIGVDFQSPVIVLPLGPTGLGLMAVGGDYAYNFIPRVEKDGVIVPNPTADQYVGWGRDIEKLDRWVAGPIDQTAIGLGVRVGLGTIFDNGWVMMLNPIGVGVFTLGPTFVLGGTGVLLKMKNSRIRGLFALDIPSESLALGLDADVEIKVSDFVGALETITLIKAHGTLDAFFSFKDPTLWYINLGTDADPLKVSVLENVPVLSFTFGPSAEGFFQINNERILFGATVSLGGEIELLDIFTIVAKLSIKFVAFIGWNPFLVRGRLALIGQLGVKIWKFKLMLTGEANVSAYLPKPLIVRAELKVKVELPWPLPNPHEAILPIKIGGDDEPTAPVLTSPLLAGEARNGAGQKVIQPQKLGAQHAMSGRTWNLDSDTTWPDLEIIVPFQRRTTDKTGTIIGPVISPENQGGYDVHHDLTKVELFDMIRSVIVPGVKGVWANGPDGESARLHLLGLDPVSWLLASIKDNLVTMRQLGMVIEQGFGYGPAETVDKARLFGEMIVRPLFLDKPLLLRTEFQPMLPARLMQSGSFVLEFEDTNGVPVAVDQVTFTLFYVTPRAWFSVNGQIVYPTVATKKLFGSVYLMTVTVHLPQPDTKIEVRVNEEMRLLFYTVTYRTVPSYSTLDLVKTTLLPGRYRLTIEGSSTATHPGDGEYNEVFPDASPVDWKVVQEFNVDYPEKLRSYIHSTTLGDNRLFGARVEDSTWNPTPYGAGFPAYRSYLGSVRLLASYMSQIFPGAPGPFLCMRLLTEELSPQIVVDASPALTSNPFGESSLSSAGQAWIKAGGSLILPDEEIIFNHPLPPAGKASLQILLIHPTKGEIPLDQWTLIISRFATFKEHLTWSGVCLTVFYTANGAVQRPTCPPLAGGMKFDDKIHLDLLHRYHPLLMEFRSLPADRIESAFARDLLDSYGMASPISKYPPELSNAPADWILPASLTNHLSITFDPAKDRFDSGAGIHFGRFAEAMGIRFGDTFADALENILHRPDHTTVEALLDPRGRPYALWLRTPEPVDWRRVAAALHIRHVTPATDCPTGYAQRHPVDLKLSILPSTDGSSAFLVGYLNGAATSLPRGEYELTLSFHADVPGLARLRPDPSVGASPEVVKLTFIQPSGLDWPTAEDHIHIAHGIINILFKYVLPPDLWGPVARGEISAEGLDRLLTRSQELSNQLAPFPHAGLKESLPSAVEAGLNGDASQALEVTEPQVEFEESMEMKDLDEALSDDSGVPGDLSVSRGSELNGSPESGNSLDETGGME